MMNPVSPSSLPSAAQSGQTSGAVARAARDFEALLLGSLLRTFEHGFSQLPGGEPSAGDYGDFGSEALANGLAARGGLGIARLIVSNLMKTQKI